MNKRGRPSSYKTSTVDAICSDLAEGKSLRTILKQPGMPTMATVFSWLREHPDFLKRYTIAKQESADALADEMLDIADDGTNDWIANLDPDNPGYRANGEHIQRSRLRVETRKWIAAKLKPKKYGDSQTVDLTNSDGSLAGTWAAAMDDEYVGAQETERRH